jgi:phosphate:Na+ symporter
VEEILSMTVDGFVNDDIDLALKVAPLGELINDMCNEIKSHHISRLQRGECAFEKGFAFDNLLTSYERVADHCSGIAVGMIELGDDYIDQHVFMSGLNKMQNGDFAKLYKEYKQKYSLEDPH